MAVTNQHSSDMVICAEGGGLWEQLGSLAVPARIIAPIYIEEGQDLEARITNAAAREFPVCVDPDS